MPTVSFVVIAYNVERYIADCLQSLQNQTNPDFEVVVVDDASTIPRNRSSNPRYRMIHASR